MMLNATFSAAVTRPEGWIFRWVPTTGKCTRKMYHCTECGTQKIHDTNHWGEIYPFCGRCGHATPWECLEPMPAGYMKPAKWKIARLGDLIDIRA